MNDGKNQNGESNLEFSLIFYQVPLLSYYNIFIHYNIIMLYYTPYLDDYLVMYFKSNHSITKKKILFTLDMNDVKNGQLFKYSINSIE